MAATTTKIAISLIILLSFYNCKKTNGEADKNVSPSIKVTDTVIAISDTVLSKKDLEDFKKEVSNKGDNYSFTRLIIHFQENNDYKELYKYAKIMADKYNRGDGYSQVFECIVAMNNNNSYIDVPDFAKINEKAKSEALKYLEKGVRLNDIGCTAKLEEIYRNGIGVKKDIKKADELKKKMEKM
ncbi:hypothetical protein [Chryseobacterium gossypii]|uniref:hypothetical protein n=1 Tax=Chryseobacterium gossypii TaxID=3231602 RepID=UPI0035257105